MRTFFKIFDTDGSLSNLEEQVNTYAKKEKLNIKSIKVLPSKGKKVTKVFVIYEKDDSKKILNEG